MAETRKGRGEIRASVDPPDDPQRIDAVAKTALLDRIDKIASHAKERAGRGGDEPSDSMQPPDAKPRQLAPVIQLPIWPDPHRAIPNPFARSALFTVGNSRRKREHFVQKTIDTFGNVEITYTGEELRQDDEDVFLQLLHISRISPLGEEIEFTAHQMLKSLNWPTNKPAYDRLRRTIHRLSATGVTVSADHGRYGYNGSLVRYFAWKEPEGGNSKSWRVCLEPRIIALFGDTTYTRVVWEHRREVSSALAKWLLNLYSSHAKPYPMKVATIHRYSGSTASRMSGFRRQLKTALEQLVGVGFLNSFEIDGADLVHVERVPVLRSE
ncbi:MAG: plasmid replication initiator TrfA [Pseudomonadota bacterium]|nr:plasmid replication initiator TrfA [Pseudomonadota bacterium]